MRAPSEVRSWLPQALVASASLFLLVPLFDAAWFHSHEWSAYVLRTAQFADGLRQGYPYPRWCPDFYGGYGSPFFVFYAPLVYFLGALLALATGTAALGLKLVCALGSVAAGLGAYHLVQGETRRSDAALLGAFAYLSTPYRVTNLTVRGDLSEFFALAVLPWTLYGYRALVHETDPRKLPFRACVAMGLHAALVVSHTLIGLWGTGIAVLVALGSAWQLWRRRAVTRLILLPGVFVGALALSCVYWLPALAERSLVRTDSMGLGYYAPEHNWLIPVKLLAPGQFQIAPLFGLAGLLAAVSVARRKRLGSEWLWLAGASALVVLVLPHASMVWEKDLLPFGRLIQFPWRLLGPAALCAAMALGLAWARSLPRRWWTDLSALALASAAYFAVALPHISVEAIAPSQVVQRGERIREMMTATTGLDEYLPRAVSNPPKKMASTLATSTPAVRVVSVRSKHVLHDLELMAHEATTMELSLHHYPGWFAETKVGPQEVTLAASSNGYVALRLPAAGRYVVRVDFGSTPIRRVAGVISLLALLGAPFGFVFAVRARRQRSAPHVSFDASREVLA